MSASVNSKYSLGQSVGYGLDIGGGVRATMTSASVVGIPTTASLLPAGTTGTFQFTRTSAGGVKTNVGSASAAGATSHSYTPVAGDVAYTIGCDILATVSAKAVSVVAAAPATVPGQPAAPVLTALAGAVSVAWSAPSDGGSAIIATEYLSIEGVTTALTTNPQTIPAVGGVATTGTIRSRNAVGWGPYSPQATSVTPALPVLRLATVNWRCATVAEKVTGTSARMGRTVYPGGQRVRNMRVKIPTFSIGNSGETDSGQYTLTISTEYNGRSVPITFNGQVSRVMLAGEPEVYSDIIDWAGLGLTANDWPENADIIARYDQVGVDANTLFTAGAVIAQDARNSCVAYDPATVVTKSPVVGTGAMVVSGPNINVRTQGFNPMFVGEPIDPATFKSLLFFGASMEDGGTDATWTAPLAMRGFGRACTGPAGNVSGGVIAASGSSTSAYTGTNIRWEGYVKHFNLGEESIGGNNLGSLNASTAIQVYKDIEKFRRDLWARFRVLSPGIRIAGYVKPPSITASSDFFATLEGQTVGAEWGMLNGTTSIAPEGLGERYRQWGIEQVNGYPPAVFNASINNVIMTVSSLVLPGRRPTIGDVITATGYTGVITGINTIATDGSGSYSISPAVPTGVTIRAFTANVVNGLDYSFGPDKVTAPGRRDLWAVASTVGIGVPGNAPLGLPAPNNTGGNHPATNHYIVLARQLRTEFLGIND